MAIENRIYLEFTVGGGVSPEEVIDHFQDLWYDAPFPLKDFVASVKELK